MLIGKIALLMVLWLFTREWEASLKVFIDGYRDFARMRREMLIAPQQTMSDHCLKSATPPKRVGFGCVTDLYWWRADLKTSVCEELAGVPVSKAATAVRRRYQLTWRCQISWPPHLPKSGPASPFLNLDLPSLTVNLIR